MLVFVEMDPAYLIETEQPHVNQNVFVNNNRNFKPKNIKKIQNISFLAS